jgi:hypothetical protein
MDRQLALKLANLLRSKCPVDSGALRLSISSVQGNPKRWLITIGNESGKEINGKCATIEYAAITNFAKTIRFKGNTYNNPNYHWVNQAVIQWVNENKLLYRITTE